MIVTPTATTKPIALLADRYGVHLEALSHAQILFVVSAVSERLRLNCPIEDTFDSLDPDALIPEDLTNTLRKLESSPQRKLVELLLYCNMAILAVIQ